MYVESVRMYVILPFSYNFCNTLMVSVGDIPNLELASWIEEVIYGGGAADVQLLFLQLSSLYSYFTSRK